MSVIGCQGEPSQSSATTPEGVTTVGICATEPHDGEWEQDPTEGGIIDWSVPVPAEGWQKAAPFDDIKEHHQYLTPVHAAHLPTGELMLFHGQSEERVWPIGEPYSAMRWHPVPEIVSKTGFPDLCSYDDDPNGMDEIIGYPGANCYADIFCAGHVQLHDGRFLTAGGNVDGTADGGGLVHTFTYDPWDGPDLVDGPFQVGESPFGWTRRGDMAVDRWYPTLTVLRDGTVLISSGASRVTGGQNTFELFDPTNNTVTPLTIANTPFTTLDPIPLYPFMFLLPNGDVFYAGGEGASEENSKGRVLIPGYNNGGTWTWDEREFTSQINGGSAVMYEPGKIMKSGGLCRGCENDSPAIKDQDNIAVAKTEAIDLSGFASGDYGAATNFLAKGDMNQPRHFHNLTLLPDGRVLATGGNKRDNGQVGDYWRNACDYQSAAIADMDNCNDQDHNGVPDNPATAYEGCPAVRSPCSYYDPDGVGGLDPGNYCPLRGNTDCDQLGTVYCGAPCEDNDECPPGSICDCPTEEPCGMQQKYCQMPCPENPMSTCGAVVHCSGGGSFCDPAKNECHATQTAEIYEPGCGAWTELDAEERPRMYHSTALLLPGGEVYSMGGGHRPPLVEQNSAQIFRPEYGAPGTASAPQIHVIPETEKYNSNKPTLTADGAQVMFDNGSASIVAERFSLLRLGSVTHQFDMDQRFMWLNITDGAHDAANVLTVESPYLQGDLPPGYYMLFLRTEEGEVSTGEYVRVPLLDSQSTVWVCPATLDLTATHTSCTVEPIDGECPFGEEQIDPVDLPLVDSAPGPVEGWHVFTPIGEVDDPLAPTARELASLDARCVAACQAHFASDPSFTANCDGVDVFGPPEPFYNGAPGPYHLVLPGQEHGEGVFAGESVACALGSTCCAAFDEELCAAAPERATPANDLLGVGQEFGLALGVSSTIQVVTDQGTYGSTLTGSTGYSFCSDGNDTAPCPFYLGSFEALATSGITASMTCADSSVAHPRLTNLSLKLSQPAFGIAQEGTDLKGFPKGALVFESAFDVDTQHFTTRGPTHADVIVTAAGTTFDATDLTVTLQVPCNTSTAAITVKVSAHSSSTGALGRPPVVTNTTAATGTCGVSRALTATVSDPDSDAGPVRWRVDGVWLAPGTSAMIITEPHVLEAIVRDARGATTTATKEVSCN